MKLGQILLHRGVIRRDQLREALRRQRAGDGPMGEILLRMGVVAREQVVAAMLTQPSASVDENTLRRVGSAGARMVPERVARRHACLGLVQADGHLVVAMADPFDRVAIAALRKETGLAILPVAAPREPLAAAIAAHYGDAATAVAS